MYSRLFSSSLILLLIYRSFYHSLIVSHLPLLSLSLSRSLVNLPVRALSSSRTCLLLFRPPFYFHFLFLFLLFFLSLLCVLSFQSQTCFVTHLLIIFHQPSLQFNYSLNKFTLSVLSYLELASAVRTTDGTGEDRRVHRITSDNNERKQRFQEKEKKKKKKTKTREREKERERRRKGKLKNTTQSEG